jgi:hypothetical protein
MSRKKLLWTIVGLGAVLILIPFRTLNCPTWDVWVTYLGGEPAAGVTVRLTYQNYSLERESHQIDAITDGRGHVEIGARTISASLAHRLVGTLSSALGEGIHASFGPHARASAFDSNGAEGDAEWGGIITDWTGEPSHMESQIVLVRPP